MKVNNKELRLYNLVRNNITNAIEFVTAIQNREVLEANEIGWAIEEFEPIQLNENWIIKAGFKKVEYKDKYWYKLQIPNEFDLHLTSDNYINNEWRVYVVDWNINCKYLHQLQNLYYALCGQELTALYEYAHQKEIYINE